MNDWHLNEIKVFVFDLKCHFECNFQCIINVRDRLVFITNNNVNRFNIYLSAFVNSSFS